MMMQVNPDPTSALDWPRRTWVEEKAPGMPRRNFESGFAYRYHFIVRQESLSSYLDSLRISRMLICLAAKHSCLGNLGLSGLLTHTDSDHVASRPLIPLSMIDKDSKSKTEMQYKSR